MARRHLCGTYWFRFDGTASALGVSRRCSVALAHLGHMKPVNRSEAVEQDGVVLAGAFEPALSLKELAAELQASCQTLYDLRSQGRGPTGFRIGRCLRFRRSEIEAWLERLEREDAERHSGGDAR
jgi:predicted DNA-binding transcriptional regulator AlpA